MIFEERRLKSKEEKKKRQNARPAHTHENALFTSVCNKRANLCFCEFGFFFARARACICFVVTRFFFFSFFVFCFKFKFILIIKNKKATVTVETQSKALNYVQFSLSRNIHRPRTDRISFNMHIFCVRILSRPRCENYVLYCVLFVRRFLYRVFYIHLKSRIRTPGGPQRWILQHHHYRAVRVVFCRRESDFRRRRWKWRADEMLFALR